eukprot:3638562-Prymnesium_polylepis.2
MPRVGSVKLDLAVCARRRRRGSWARNAGRAASAKDQRQECGGSLESVRACGGPGCVDVA